MRDTPNAARLIPVLSVMAGLALSSGCRAPAAPETRAPDRPPDVVLVTIDTLRPDHLSTYGYDRATSPFLQRLAAESVRFDRAYSTSSWTLPAVVSLLTGLDALAHGVTQGVVSPDGEIAYQDIVSERLLLLPELLQQAGYVTVGLTANAHLDEALGFAQGFDYYECVGFSTADWIEARLDRALSVLDPARPRFVWIHYFDPHWPYRDHGADTAALVGRGRRLQPELTARLARLTTPAQFHQLGIETDDEVLRSTIALYDGEVRYVDGFVERLFEALAPADDALLIVTSDHGEEFLDHGDVGHALSLFEETIRVPLLVRFPGARYGGTTVDDNVSLIDIVPTVLELADPATAPPGGGRSLLGVVRDGEDPDRPIRASLSVNAFLETIVVGEWKYIHDLEDPSNRLLFDLALDPHETTDLSRRYPTRAEALRRLLMQLRSVEQTGAIEQTTVELDPAQTDRLRSLGYLR